jgi:hypothetical protein
MPKRSASSNQPKPPAGDPIAGDIHMSPTSGTQCGAPEEPEVEEQATIEQAEVSVASPMPVPVDLDNAVSGRGSAENPARSADFPVYLTDTAFMTELYSAWCADRPSFDPLPYDSTTRSGRRDLLLLHPAHARPTPPHSGRVCGTASRTGPLDGCPPKLRRQRRFDNIRKLSRDHDGFAIVPRKRGGDPTSPASYST